MAECFRIPREVQPMARPALAIMRRGEQALDNLGERIRGMVAEKGVDFFRRRRQADEIKRDPADKGGFVGLTGGH